MLYKPHLFFCCHANITKESFIKTGLLSVKIRSLFVKIGLFLKLGHYLFELGHCLYIWDIDC